MTSTRLGTVGLSPGVVAVVALLAAPIFIGGVIHVGELAQKGDYVTMALYAAAISTIPTVVYYMITKVRGQE